MTERYDACTPSKGRDGKTYWTKIGSAWFSDKGKQVVLTALPLTDAEGRCVINLFEPKARDDAPRQTGGNGGNRREELNDSIPF